QIRPKGLVRAPSTGLPGNGTEQPTLQSEIGREKNRCSRPMRPSSPVECAETTFFIPERAAPRLAPYGTPPHMDRVLADWLLRGCPRRRDGQEVVRGPDDWD